MWNLGMLGISFRRRGSIGNSSHLQFDPELVVNLPSLKLIAKATEYEWLENDDSYQNGLFSGAFAVSFGDCIWPHGLKSGMWWISMAADSLALDLMNWYRMLTISWICLGANIAVWTGLAECMRIHHWLGIVNACFECPFLADFNECDSIWCAADDVASMYPNCCFGPAAYPPALRKTIQASDCKKIRCCPRSRFQGSFMGKMKNEVV